MKTVVWFFCLLAIASLDGFGEAPAKVAKTADGETVVSFTLPLADEEGELDASFNLGQTKGLLGPASNPSDQTGFSNGDGTLFAINHQPVTKSSYVHLFVKSEDGNLLFVNRVNEQVAKLLSRPWRETAKGFLRVEKISGRRILLQTVDFGGDSRSDHQFWVTVNESGAISLATESNEEQKTTAQFTFFALPVPGKNKQLNPDWKRPHLVLGTPAKVEFQSEPPMIRVTFTEADTGKLQSLLRKNTGKLLVTAFQNQTVMVSPIPTECFSGGKLYISNPEDSASIRSLATSLQGLYK